MRIELFVIDSEGDGLIPTKFYCLSAWSPKYKQHTVSSYDDMRRLFDKADVVVGHNIIRWDIPHLERILKIKIKCKLVDTLALSWVMFPDRKKHGLELWGEEFGVQKPKITDWFNLSQEEYEHRCAEDVKINARLWLLIWNKLLHLYNSENDVWRYIDYITFKMKCAQLQEKSKWKIDVDYCTQELATLLKEQTLKVDALQKAMPKVPNKEKRTTPKRLYKQDGTLTKIGQSWFRLLDSRNLPHDTNEVEIITGYEEGNPKSPEQIKEWLFSLGWKPTEHKHVKDKKTGEIRQIPQINLPNNKGICPGIKRLYEKEPSLELLEGLSILNHRIPILKGFLDTRDKNDCVVAAVQGLTNTLRFQHAHPCVNLPRSDRPHAKAIRGSLIAREGYILCGADMSSLEDRLKQHYIFPIDPDYVNTMLRADFDPHIELAMMAGKLSLEDKQFYQWYEEELAKDKDHQFSDNEKKNYKVIKATRSIFKNGNYACQYGAFPKRLAITCAVSMSEAKEIFEAYWKLNYAIKIVSARQSVKHVNDEMWLRNPINGFYYSLREEKDRFSTLVQGSASYVFDLWLEYILEKREQLTGQFHDEIIIEIKKGFENKATELLQECIDKANNKLKLNRELAIGIQFGTRYSAIH